MNLEEYRSRETEQTRTADLLSLLPTISRTILEIGARDGHHTRMLAQRFDAVTALDLTAPAFTIDRVTTVAGDATALQFPDRSFDCVLCAEVLEHVPDVSKAASELCRVARHAVIVGVPYRQDTRSGCTTCSQCGKTNPPYGHVHTFTDERLCHLFRPWTQETVHYVGETNERTNRISAGLMECAGNPYGTYDQEEPCIYCGSRLQAPVRLSPADRVLCKMAHLLNRAQQSLSKPWANWVHARFVPPAG